MKNIKICISIIYVILSVKSLKSLIYFIKSKNLQEFNKNNNNKKLQSMFSNSLIPIQKWHMTINIWLIIWLLTAQIDRIK